MTTATATLITISGRQRRFASWMTDVLVYIVVLNLFVEFVDTVVIESFWISILTAVLLKAMLDVIIGIEHRVSAFFGTHSGASWKVVGILSGWAILFASKFLILEVVDIVFGDEVNLGHFIEIVLLVIALMLTRAVFGWMYQRLAPTPEELERAGAASSIDVPAPPEAS